MKEEDKLTEEEANNDMLRDYHKKQKEAKKESKSKVRFVFNIYRFKVVLRNGLLHIEEPCRDCKLE